ncbi:GntR family transcriptional regulator [Butyrivibrio sp. NC2002]|uniref:GntR family transcriptional regulator n=1 Tax=Butyrivibrio sp. NC2002 TaxID=1410610 RepID=UPI00068958E5|nr:GntR family transcriptional regulator [Butyrivibrio sp. NC2002]
MLIEIDYRDKRPIYEQISSKMEGLILRGIIGPDEALPSVRSLAMDLSINPNTIQKAYDNLEQRGFCYSVAGRGRFAENTSQVMPQRRKEFFDEMGNLLNKADTLCLDEKEVLDFVKKHFKDRKEEK